MSEKPTLPLLKVVHREELLEKGQTNRAAMVYDAAPSPPDPLSIWLRTRNAVTSAQYPPRISYTIAIAGKDGDSFRVDHYRGNCRPTQGAIRVSSMSDEQLAATPAPKPRGFDFSVFAFICKGECDTFWQPVGPPALSQDLLGEPILDPTYMFGVRYEGPREDTPAPAPTDSALKTIQVVHSVEGTYRVELLDEPIVEGVSTFHLRLTPRRKPKDNRLRELWVGQNDFLPRRAVIAGNFTVAPLDDVPWIIDFSIADGAPMIRKEVAQDALYLIHRRVVRGAVIDFENVRESGSSLSGEPLIQPKLNEESLVEPID